MEAPPFEAGAEKDTDMAESLVAVADTPVGIPGTTAATETVELEFDATLLIAFVAVTTQRIVLPTSADTNT
jgi:hypothetical protein